MITREALLQEVDAQYRQQRELNQAEQERRLAEAVARLFPEPEKPAGEILTNARQAEAMNRALVSLESALRAMDEGLTPDAVLTEAEYALDALSELTGRSVKADVTERIFSRFCVGK